MIRLSILLILTIYAFTASCEPCNSSYECDDSKRYITDLSFHSSIIKQEVKYAIYLPNDYGSKNKEYSVVYLLHGFGCDHNSWNDEHLHVSSLIQHKEDKGQIEEMIYVMPQGFNSYYVNTYDGKYNYMDMFTKELIPHIDDRYSTKANKENRAVVGFSMGGFGAMILASKYPELFSISAPLSMSFRTDYQYMTEPSETWDKQWGTIFGGIGLNGQARLTDYYLNHSPFHILTDKTVKSYANLNFFLDCGDDEEQLLIANEQLHQRMRQLNIDHEYRVRNGGHTSKYWRDSMKEVLIYISNYFHQGSTAYKNKKLDIKDSNYTRTIKEVKIDGSLVIVSYPSNFDNQSKYQAVYCVHDGLSTSEINHISYIIAEKDSNKKQIMIFADANISAHNLLRVHDYFQSNYDITDNIGVGINNGGEVIYNLSIENDTTFTSVYLFDAFLGDNIKFPNRSVCYYIDITDMGINYTSAGNLYILCKKNDVKFEYRVRDGVNSISSLYEGLAEALPLK